MISKAPVAASTKPMVTSILGCGENYGYKIIREVKGMYGGTEMAGWYDLSRAEPAGAGRVRPFTPATFFFS